MLYTRYCSPLVQFVKRLLTQPVKRGMTTALLTCQPVACCQVSFKPRPMGRNPTGALEETQDDASLFECARFLLVFFGGAKWKTQRQSNYPSG